MKLDKDELKKAANAGVRFSAEEISVLQKKFDDENGFENGVSHLSNRKVVYRFPKYKIRKINIRDDPSISSINPYEYIYGPFEESS